MKNRKILIIVLAGVMLFAGIGITTGSLDKVIAACKAYIYCQGAPLEAKDQVR